MAGQPGGEVTGAQVEGWFKSIAANPDSRPQARPHGDGVTTNPPA
ncbi:hypothetical protein AB0B85_32155 [Micromonospora sp. NPDC049044]